MTDQELQQLAREYAEQNPPHGITDDIIRKQIIGFNASVFEQMLRWLTKTYCIVSREKVNHEFRVSYNDSFNNTMCIDRTYARGRYQVLRDLFDTEQFEGIEKPLCRVKGGSISKDNPT